MTLQLQDGPIALIGDLHGHWTNADVAYFNRSEHVLLLVTGDLGSGTLKNGVEIARSLARLQKPTLVVPGNNDAPFSDEIAAEFRFQTGLVQLLGLVPGAQATGKGAGQVALCGYQTCSVALGSHRFCIVVGRPFAMGGSELSFPDALANRYEVSSMEESSSRLRALIDRAPEQDLLFLAHNGPTGLGDRQNDIWGCDFRLEQGDWGDCDLRAAVDHARKTGRNVLAVVAGHMHRRTGEAREGFVRHDGVLYVNPAVTPRVRGLGAEVRRHHVRLSLGAHGVEARDVHVEDEG